MIAKRSVRQISFLHVYHHSSIAAIWWAITYHAPGGDGENVNIKINVLWALKLWIFFVSAYFSAAMNSGVHVIMYGYYFLAAALGKDEKLKRKYLFWGRWVQSHISFLVLVNLTSKLFFFYYQLCDPTPNDTIFVEYGSSLLVNINKWTIYSLDMQGKKWFRKSNSLFPLKSMYFSHFQLLFYYMISLLVLFGHFYVKKYLAPKKAVQVKRD